MLSISVLTLPFMAGGWLFFLYMLVILQFLMGSRALASKRLLQLGCHVEFGWQSIGFLARQAGLDAPLYEKIKRAFAARALQWARSCAAWLLTCLRRHRAA